MADPRKIVRRLLPVARRSRRGPGQVPHRLGRRDRCQRRQAHRDPGRGLLGRRTYDEWSGFWPTSEIEPFASFINAAPKYVATSTPLNAEWSNSHAIEGDLTDFVRTLKAQPGGDIGIHGSISITQSLLAANLVDELRLVIAPTIVTTGQRLLANLPPTHLETIRSTHTPAGHLLVDYRVVH